MGFLDAPTSQATTASLGGKVDKSSVVNVRDYGVVLDGSAATGVALTNAISAANLLGLPLRLPKGTFLIDQVNIPSNTTIEGVGPGTVIQQNLSTQPSLQALGTDAALGALTADLAKGATTITISQSWGLVAGDKIVVSDNVSYAGTDSSYKSGEMLTVASSTGTTITLQAPVRGSFSNNAGSYTVANVATLTKLNTLKNITLRNMAFTGNASAGSLMMFFKNVENLTLEGVSTTGAQSGFCQFDNCYNVDVSNFALNGLVDNWSTGSPGYGFVIKQACHTVRIHDGVSTMARHAITTIGGAYGAPRNMTFSGIVSNDPSSTAAIDTHSAGEGILITGCHISYSNNGITVRARNTTVRGNRIHYTSGNGVLLSENARDVVIDGNSFVGCSVYGVRIGAANSTHQNVEVRANTFADTKGAGAAVSVGVGSNDVRIVSNTIQRADKYGIDVDASCTDVHIARNDVSDASLVGTFPGINASGTQAAGVFDLIGNTVKQKANLMNRAVATTRTQGRMTGNRAFGTYLSTGSEFQGGTGFTLADNVLYA